MGQYDDMINKAYREALGRDVGPVGLADRSKEAAGGMTYEQMVAGLKKSPEYLSRNSDRPTPMPQLDWSLGSGSPLPPQYDTSGNWDPGPKPPAPAERYEPYTQADAGRLQNTSQAPTLGTNTQSIDAYNRGMADLRTALTGAQSDLAAGKTSALGNIDTYYNEATGRYEPYTQAGESALSRLEEKIAAGPGKMTEGEGYQYRMDQAMQEIERRASAQGYLGDPRMAEEMQKTAQGIASDERQRFLDEYYMSLGPDTTLTGIGATATGELGRMGETAGLTKAGIETSTASQLAQMGMGVGQTALTAGMGAAQSDVQSALTEYGLNLNKYGIDVNKDIAQQQLGLNKYGIDVNKELSQQQLGLEFDKLKTGAELDYAKLGLTEILSLRDQAWKSGETELQRMFEGAMAEKGYEFYAQMRDKNESSNWWNSLIKAGGFVLGSYLGGSGGSSSFWT